MLHILTLNWNGADKLQKLYQSLLPSLQDITYTWWIKDNGSRDNSLQAIEDFRGSVKAIPYKDNRQNFAEGMNYLFQQASPGENDLVMLLNNDVVFRDTDSINKMLDIMHKDTSVGVVGARLLYPNSENLQHAGVVFTQTPAHFRAGQASDEVAEKNRLFQAVTGAVLITRPECYRNVCTNNKSGIHGMDEKYHWAFDDVDLCLSVNYSQKKKIVYCGGTNISHEESATLKKNPTNKLFLNHNLLYLFQKWQKTYVADRDIYTLDSRHNLYRG